MSSLKITTWVLLIAVIVLSVSLVAAADAGRGQAFFAWVAAVPGRDKAGHLLLFGTLSFLANLLFNDARLPFLYGLFRKGSVFVFIPVVLEEFSQLFVRTRDFEVWDLAADALGIAVGGWLAMLALRRLQSRTARMKPAPDPPPVPQPVPLSED